MRKDIQSKEDIKILVDAFYARVRSDVMLGPVFESKISDWNEHLPIMYRFWNTVLFGVAEYVGNPLMKHRPLPIGSEHFAQWLLLFHQTMDEFFEGPVAEQAKKRAIIMAHTLNARIEESRQATTRV